MARLSARRLFHFVNTYRYFLFVRGSVLEAPRFNDYRQSAYKGVNMLERIIQEPEPGTYCFDAAGNHYERWLGPGEPTTAECNQRFDTELGLGGGRYLDSEWTNEYYYKANRLGFFYDKLAAVQQMTTSSGRFVQNLADLFDRRAFSLGYLRVYRDPMLQRFSALISGDQTGYRPRVITEANGDRSVRYMPFFDELDADGGSIRERLEGQPTIDAAWSWSLQYWSLAYALGNWSSVADWTPEFHRMTKIAVRGTPEDIEYPDDIEIVEFTDPQTQITYRAPVIPAISPIGLGADEFPAYYGDLFHRRRGEGRDWGIGADVLRQANDILTTRYEPAQAACAASPGETSPECIDFLRATEELNEHVGFIDLVRKFNFRAERY